MKSSRPEDDESLLMKYSVWIACLSQPGTPMVLLIRSPRNKAKITYSMPQSTNAPFPARGGRARRGQDRGKPAMNSPTLRPTG